MDDDNKVTNVSDTTAEPVASEQKPAETVASIESPATTDVATAAPVAASAPSPAKNKFKLFGKLGVVPLAIAAFALIGGSAAAYYGVVVPNKPENVLKAALDNTLNQTKVKYDAKVAMEFTEAEAPVKAMNATFKGQSDFEKNAAQVEFEITASGVKLPLELRSIDKSIFIKIGDISSIKGLAAAAAPEYAELVDVANDVIGNQWIEIDETLLKQANMGCVTDSTFKLTPDDVKLLQTSYSAKPFATVKSTSSDTVNGRSAYKYEIDIDDKKANEYGSSLSQLSAVKKLKECGGSEDFTNSDVDVTEGTTPITIWVDKGTKTLSKVALKTTEKSEKENNVKGTIEISFTYGQADITKPEGAKSAMEIAAELQSIMMSQYSDEFDGTFVEGAFDIKDYGNFDY